MKALFDSLEEQRKYEIIEALTILKTQARDSGANTFIWDVSRDSFNYVIDKAIKELEYKNG